MVYMPQIPLMNCSDIISIITTARFSAPAKIHARITYVRKN